MQVINLEPGIAITQNFVSRTNLPHVLRFLEPGRTDLVSGCSMSDRGDLHRRFVEALRSKHPEILDAALSADEARKGKKAKVICVVGQTVTSIWLVIPPSSTLNSMHFPPMHVD